MTQTSNKMMKLTQNPAIEGVLTLQCNLVINIINITYIDPEPFNPNSVSFMISKDLDLRESFNMSHYLNKDGKQTDKDGKPIEVDKTRESMNFQIPSFQPGFGSGLPNTGFDSNKNNKFDPNQKPGIGQSFSNDMDSN